jgi:DNA-binding NarL/FixJ family response regulator
MSKPGGSAAVGGQRLFELNEDLQVQAFRATLILAALLFGPAAAMTLLVDRDVTVRLALLVVASVSCGVVAYRAEWCASKLRRQGSRVLLPATFGAAVLVAAGSRQDAIFLVVAVAVAGTPAVVEVAWAMGAGAIVTLGYVLGVAVRGESLLVEGSAGDLAAVLSMLAAIYAGHRVVGLAMAVITDFNRDAADSARERGRAMPNSSRGHYVGEGDPRDATAVRLTAEEATDRAEDGAAEKLSRYGLTAAEQVVALLASEGWPPSRIAETLKKSVRTVETQLGSILQKLEVPNRSALAARLVEILGSTDN